MKYLFLMGGSGSGKTTLAKNLEKSSPTKFHRVLEITTRKIRDDETEGVDYKYVSDEEFDKIKDSLFETVNYQFLPSRYGASYSECSQDRSVWNIVVASIEGFMTAMRNVKPSDTCVLVNILLDDILDVNRSGRDPKAEEKINLSVINSLMYENVISINGKNSFYYELPLSKLKSIRNVPAVYIQFFTDTLNNLIRKTLKEQLKNVETYNDLIYIFMSNSEVISKSTLLLDLLEISAKKFKKSVKTLCDDATDVVMSLYNEDKLNE